MTHLRQAMLDELHRRNYAATTITYYIRNVEQFARFFKRSPDRLNPTHRRSTKRICSASGSWRRGRSSCMSARSASSS